MESEFYNLGIPKFRHITVSYDISLEPSCHDGVMGGGGGPIYIFLEK